MPIRKEGKHQYLKYAYWFDVKEMEDLKKETEKRKIEMYKAKYASCEVLDPSKKIGYANPDVWNRVCWRQGSWYRESSKAGKYLVVSSFKLLKKFNRGIETMITESNFSPKKFPSEEEKIKMVKCEAYQNKKPREWEKISEIALISLKQFYKEAGVNEPFDEIFLTHCANHANFLKPRYYIKRGNGIIPYSIADTPHLCSSCAEFFNLVGEQHEKKLVRPCPASLTYGKLTANKYYEVKTLKD